MLHPGVGTPIASGDGYGSPDCAFDDDPATFWVSAERGSTVKGNVWIGYEFGAPVTLRRILVEQTTNRPYRQDLVQVEKSVDGGKSWVPAAAMPFKLTGEKTWIGSAGW
jgi:hypothetical protein